MLKQFHRIILLLNVTGRVSVTLSCISSTARVEMPAGALVLDLQDKTFKLSEGHLKSLQRFSVLIWAALSRICASVRGKIKTKVFDRILSPLNPSHAEDNIV